MDAIKLVDSSHARSKCITSRSLPNPGASLLIAGPPTVTVLLDSFKRVRCDECLQVLGTRPIECRMCREDVYCDSSCQQKAWLNHHKILCKVLPRIRHALLSVQMNESERTDGLLLCKLAVQYFSNINEASLPNLTKAHASSLSSSPSETFLSLLSTPTPSSSLLPELLPPFLPSHLTPDILSSLLSRFQRNNHVLSTPDMKLEPFAHAVLAPISRAVNHSCAPSAAVSCSWGADGLIVGLRTLRALKEGEEVTISYLDPLTSLKTRRETLKTIYYFDCVCSLCCSSADPPASSPLPPPVVIPSNPALPRASAKPTAYPDIPRPEGQFIGRIPEKEIANLTKRFEDAHHEGRWSEAEKLGEAVLKVYWLGYGPFWPLIGTHLLSQASISLNLSILLPVRDPTGLRHLARAYMFLSWANVVLGVCWGEGSERQAAIEPVKSALWGELKEIGIIPP
ncbi:Predicted histone tail methylase containing SET domain [Phaffia rhodozyma]|uniref:Predicted histone tail methylase containing SET domain n=1 Tax=Phaffia rhodozyma TaxID=264483 RepID=A0A0F7SRX7_PHARH|nr:Predicted histone tail methylase containing SET domain [Phaffia rhodozyma]